MKKAVVILDYNNVFCLNYNLSVERREGIMISLLKKIVATQPEIDFIEIRYYGGWYKEKELTRIGSKVMSEHLTMDLFPISFNDKTFIHGEQTVVQSVCDVDFVWFNTYREKPGIPRLIINREAKQPICERNKTQCPINIIERLAKKTSNFCSVEGCLMNNEQAFVQMGQKMVDAMMICDIITYSSKTEVEVIYVLTDDVDLFPAIALCRSKQQDKEIVLGIVNGRNVEPYKDYLKFFNVEVFQIYDVRGT